MHVAGLMRDRVQQGSGIGAWRASPARTRAVFPRAMRNYWEAFAGSSHCSCSLWPLSDQCVEVRVQAGRLVIRHSGPREGGK